MNPDATVPPTLPTWAPAARYTLHAIFVADNAAQLAAVKALAWLSRKESHAPTQRTLDELVRTITPSPELKGLLRRRGFPDAVALERASSNYAWHSRGNRELWGRALGCAAAAGVGYYLRVVAELSGGGCREVLIKHQPTAGGINLTNTLELKEPI